MFESQIQFIQQFIIICNYLSILKYNETNSWSCAHFHLSHQKRWIITWKRKREKKLYAYNINNKMYINLIYKSLYILAFNNYYKEVTYLEAHGTGNEVIDPRNEISFYLIEKYDNQNF